MGISWVIETHEALASTQDTLKNKAVNGAPEGAVVQAGVQTAGRGRHGREWVSQPGNLYLSLLLRPECSALVIGQLSLLIGVAIGRAIKSLLQQPDALMLKWPNDVLLGGEKCAGILIETELSDDGLVNWLCVGFGVNIASAPELVGACLADAMEQGVSVERLRDETLKHIDEYYALWQSSGFEDIRSLWLGMAHKKDAPVQVKIGSKIIQGTFDGINDQGGLLLRNNDNQQKVITAGDVYLEGA